MIQNEGETDRLVRVVVGAILIMIGYSVGEGVWQVVAFVVGGILIITGFSGFCLIYKMLNISTLNK